MFGLTLGRPSNSVGSGDSKWRRLSLTNGAGWASFFGMQSSSGQLVTRDTALQLAAVWACIRLVAQAIAVLPLPLYRKGADGGRESMSGDPLAEMLAISPNGSQTSVEFWEGMVAWLAAHGNAYSEKGMIGSRVVSLEPPFCSDNVYPYRNSDGALVYRISDRGRSEVLPADKIFHVRGFGFGGDMGLSAIRYGVQTFGSAIATVETSGKMFANGMQTAGVLSSEQGLKKDQRSQIQEIMEKYVGSKNAGKLMILEAGLKYQQLTLNPEDAQMLESRRFDIEDVCRWFGVPPLLVGHAASGQTMWGSGIEQLLIAFLIFGLNPLLVRIEQRIRKDIIPLGMRGKLYAEFNREALLQADSAAKASFLSIMTQNGLMTRNEGRSKLNLPKDKSAGADKLTAQMNLAPLDQLGGNADQQAKAALLSWLGVQTEARP